jgi:Tol biopolymer transport system component
VAGALILAAAGFGFYRYAGPKDTNISFSEAKLSRLTNSGNVVTTAISPDGKWLVYATADGEKRSLWLQQAAVAGSGAQILPPARVDYTGLTFSPDGTYLFYTAVEVDGVPGAVYQLPVLGGSARKLFSNVLGKVSFSPDGEQVTYYRADEGKQRLMVANIDGTAQRPLIDLSGNEFLAQSAQGPAWSPDGKTIAVTMGTLSPRRATVAAVAAGTGEIDFVSPKVFYDAADLLWLPNGRGMLILANEQPGFLKIWQISYPSGEARQITKDLSNYSAISLPGDAKSLATVQGTTISNIWAGDSANPASLTQITTGSDQNFQPAWASNGRIVYTKYCCSFFRDLYITDRRSGGNPKQLTTKVGANHEADVSADSRFIVFTSDRTGTGCVWRIDMDGSNPLQLTLGSDGDPSISPDGQEVAFVRKGAQGGIWKIGIDGGTPVQLTDKEAISPRFSPDGKQLVCLYRGGATAPFELAVMASEGGNPNKSFPLPEGYVQGSLNWSRDSRSILYAVNKDGITNIWALPTDGGAPKQLTNFKSGLIDSYDLTADGKQIAVSRVTPANDVVVITEFESSK